MILDLLHDIIIKLSTFDLSDTILIFDICNISSQTKINNVIDKPTAVGRENKDFWLFFKISKQSRKYNLETLTLVSIVVVDTVSPKYFGMPRTARFIKKWYDIYMAFETQQNVRRHING